MEVSNLETLSGIPAVDPYGHLEVLEVGECVTFQNVNMSPVAFAFVSTCVLLAW